jgi:CRISPR-associated protein Csh2
MAQKKIEHKSEILFLYETSYNIPNGDPFTGEQRYDEETKKILVSDVRMKRYVRDYLSSKGKTIYVVGDKTHATGAESGSASRLKSLQSTDHYKEDLDKAIETAKKAKDKNFSSALYVMKKCIDVRLFGGISTAKGDAVNLTGPVQFSLLNPSLNEVNLRMHQNTTVFSSSAEKSQGSIGTTTLVPYSLLQIHGWLNPKVAELTGMEESDLKAMFEGLWYGTSGEGSSHSRSKIGQNSILMIEVVYSKSNKKIYGLDRLIQLNAIRGKKGEEIRSMDDYELNFAKLIKIADSDFIQQINYYTEIEAIENQLKDIPKFKKLEL